MSTFYKHFCIYTCALKKGAPPIATLALVCSDTRCTDRRPPYVITNFEFDLCSFFIGGGNRSTPKEPLRHDQKAAITASDMNADLTRFH